MAIAFFGALCSASALAADPKRKPAAFDPAAPITEQRVALVIGNGNYKFSPLNNSVNDAEDIAKALRGLGFQVTLKLNQSRDGMAQAIRAFGNQLKKGGTGLFYYAGHGMQVKGKNFLIPVDADIQEEDEVPYRAIDANELLAKMESAKNRVNLVILDACRNNPFARSFRSGSQGLAQMDAPVGTLIAFATAPGSVAADGSGRNGLYTQHLLAAMNQPGLKIEDVFKRVRQGVREGSDDRQIPWENTSLEGDFYFKPGKEAPPAQVAALASPPPVAPVSVAKKLTLLVRGYPVADGFWEKETDDSYSQKAAQLIERDLIKMGGTALKIDTVTEQARARPVLTETESNAHSRNLCQETQSDLLVTARIESEIYSGLPSSANWPDLYLSIFDCGENRKYTEKKRLTPSNQDSFSFAADLAAVTNKFLREYRYLYQVWGAHR